MHARKALLISIIFAGASIALVALLLGLGEGFAFRDWPGGPRAESPRLELEDEPETAQRAPSASTPGFRPFLNLPPRRRSARGRDRDRSPERAERGKRRRERAPAGTEPTGPVRAAPAPEDGATEPVVDRESGPQPPAPPSPGVGPSPPAAEPAPDEPPAQEPEPPRKEDPPRKAQPPRQEPPPQEPEPYREPAAAAPPAQPYKAKPQRGGRPDSSHGKRPRPAHTRGGAPGQAPRHGRGPRKPKG